MFKKIYLIKVSFSYFISYFLYILKEKKNEKKDLKKLIFIFEFVISKFNI